MSAPAPEFPSAPSLNDLRDALAPAGLPGQPTEKTLKGLVTYLTLLGKWNRRYNLVGRQGWRDVLLDLVLDSLFLAPFLVEHLETAAPVSLDLGSGAGLPGIPLRLAWTAGSCRLVEVRAKRVAFLRLALAQLQPVDTHVFDGPAEQALTRFGPVDLVLSRAFKPWPDVLALVGEHLSPRGRVLVMAGEEPPETFPTPFTLLASRSYRAGLELDQSRSLWLLAPERA